MSALKTFTFRDANTLELRDNVVSNIIAFRDRTGAARTPPVEGVRNLGGGLYGVMLSGVDVLAGTSFLVEPEPAVVPTHVSGSAYADSAPIHAMHFENPDGSLWDGDPPTVPLYQNAAGVPLVPPSLVALLAPYFYGLAPTPSDLAAGVGYQVVGAPGSIGIYEGSFLIDTDFGADPSAAVAALLASVAPGPSLGVVGVSIFTGPVRPAAPPAIPHQAIFCLLTGGPPPSPYFQNGGTSASFYRATVQVRIRGPQDQFRLGELLALQVRDKLHLAQLSGFVRCAANGSAPLYLGLDDTEHHEWSVNVTIWFKQ